MIFYFSRYLLLFRGVSLDVIALKSMYGVYTGVYTNSVGKDTHRWLRATLLAGRWAKTLYACCDENIEFGAMKSSATPRNTIR